MKKVLSVYATAFYFSELFHSTLIPEPSITVPKFLKSVQSGVESSITAL